MVLVNALMVFHRRLATGMNLPLVSSTSERSRQPKALICSELTKWLLCTRTKLDGRVVS